MAAAFSSVLRVPSPLAEPGPCAPPANEIPPAFEVVGTAARGTFCEVWQLRHRETGDRCALKRLRAEWRDHATARQLLANEVRVARAVSSRNVVALAGCDIEPRPFCALFEWLEGTTLEQQLSLEPALPAAEAVWIARQCAQGLLELKEAGFTHGDIKPSNIFLMRQSDLKLVDLGFARALGAAEKSTTPRALAGTAQYMAPEALLRCESNPVLKDVYSLGVTLFRMLAGELPIVGETTADVLRRQRASRPPQLRRKCPQVPRELAQLIQRMLAKQPLRRPADLRALVRTLIDFELSLFTQQLAG